MAHARAQTCDTNRPYIWQKVSTLVPKACRSGVGFKGRNSPPHQGIAHAMRGQNSEGEFRRMRGDSETAEAVESLRIDVQRLTQGLMAMLRKVEAQEPVLLRILDCVEPKEDDSPLVETLKDLLAAVQQLPEGIARAVVETLQKGGR